MAMFVAAVLLLIQGVSEVIKLALDRAPHIHDAEVTDVR